MRANHVDMRRERERIGGCIREVVVIIAKQSKAKQNKER
jgi:hypothetical protein